ncbi:MAG TPA: alpha/beta hydrolase-fold protein [Flavobacterium sp.]
MICFLFLFLFCGVCSNAANVDTLQISSAAMGKTYKAAVALPESYARSKKAYPVMYLLHGAYGHFDDWLRSTPDPNAVKNLADQYNIIIVMPEGENFSFYLDSPTNKESQFETYIIRDVIGKIDRTYRTISNKKGRVISGLSMGGHGALYLSTRHPEMFCAVGSMSGAVDLASILERAANDDTAKNVDATVRLPRESYPGYAVVNMVDKMKVNALPTIIDIGVEDFLIEMNRELHRRLLYANVPHEYTERPGAHTWDYWQNALPYHVLFFSKILQTNKSDN